MRNIIVGTSGHIDHGKTSILKELTGIDSDRLQEEKERGISIDIGFSFVNFNNHRIGIIDMPGHEKFIKNMLAGAHGIDIALLVIACDDGIMPQTKEHFDILSLLDIKHGIICLNKTDLATTELIEQRESEIRRFFKGSFLESAPIVKTSIKDNDSILELGSVLSQTIENIDLKETEKPIFRMAIDRSFSLKGIGTVITGTTQGKNVSLFDELEVYPTGETVSIKNIQNHNNNVNTLAPGNRCALNISKLRKDDIKRGFVIATKDSLTSSDFIDVKISVLANQKKSLKNNQRLRIYHQTKEVMARVRVLEGNEINPGKEAYAQLILEKPLISLNGDRGIIRQYSPLITIAGFEVVNTQAQKPGKDKSVYLERLMCSNTDNKSIIEEVVQNNPFSTSEQIKKLASINTLIDDDINSLVEQKRIFQFEKGKKIIYLHIDYLKIKENEVFDYLVDYHKKNPLKVGCITNEVNKKFFVDVKSKLFLEIVKSFEKVSTRKQYIFNNDFKIILSPEHHKIKNMIVSNYKNNPYKPNKVEDIKHVIKNKVDFELVFEMLVNQGVLVHIQDSMFLLDSQYDRLLNFIYDHYDKTSKITITDIKEFTQSSRKFIVAFLEYFDKKNITKRVDDYRVCLRRNK